MKVQSSLMGLIFLTSATLYAQLDQPTKCRSETAQSDLCDTAHRDLGEPSTLWPGENTAAARTEDSRPAIISIQQLQHKVSKRAAKECGKGREAFENGNKEAAKESFQKAIEIDPEFADAHNDLGVILEKFGEHTAAAEQFQKAVQLAPYHREATANLSIALYELKRFHEACAAARRAMQIDPGSLYVRYVLAICLMEDRRDGKDALNVLEGSAGRIPSADR